MKKVKITENKERSIRGGQTFQYKGVAKFCPFCREQALLEKSDNQWQCLTCGCISNGEDKD